MGSRQHTEREREREREKERERLFPEKILDTRKPLCRRFPPSARGLKHLDAGYEAPAGGTSSPEVPKTRESATDRRVRVGRPPTDIKGNGGMISRIRALVSF
jgi:hypothetical protein